MDIQDEQLDIDMPNTSNAQAKLTSTANDTAVDHDVAVDVEFDSTASANSVRFDLRLAVSADEEVYVRVQSDLGNAKAFKVVGGSSQYLGSFWVGKSTASRRLRARFVDGELSAKMWDAGSAEPTGWDYQTSASDVDQPGSAGIWALRFSGTHTIGVDNWLQRDPTGTAAETTTDYDFDGLGRMVEADNVVYTYDGMDRIATRDGVSLSYSGLGLQPSSDGTTYIARDAAGRPVAIGDGTNEVTVGLDRHGDLVVSFDSGGVVDSVAFDPFGTELARTGATSLMVGFQGHYTDPDADLVGMGARWYQPGSGSFLSRDTYNGMLETPVSLNRYTYAHNNPIGFIDPDGHRPCWTTDCSNPYDTSMVADPGSPDNAKAVQTWNYAPARAAKAKARNRRITPELAGTTGAAVLDAAGFDDVHQVLAAAGFVDETVDPNFAALNPDAGIERNACGLNISGWLTDQ